MSNDRRTAKPSRWMLHRKPDDKATRIDEANWRATWRDLGLGRGAVDQLCHEEETLERERRIETKGLQVFVWAG